MPPHLKNKSSKILHICDCIQRIAWTPKKFLYAFLKNTHIAVATRRGYWAYKQDGGWKSALESLYPERGIERLQIYSGNERLAETGTGKHKGVLRVNQVTDRVNLSVFSFIAIDSIGGLFDVIFQLFAA
ncbi:hypothetical protein PCANC_13723 [Puccinia coronata f. sp. avenae]|uniref:Uncharacterized protein n=1 Tax=Puccinia coronata f. sp. avenae TaxID=200324 RepID=A0A2N5VFM6_9BASI|nr:hypothetical protein PCANC_13723 [Puccinia coronata f. sp. avenae]